MRTSFLTLGVFLATSTIALAQSPRDGAFNQVENGRYLTILGDCQACHTEPGGVPFAGGVVLATPFGNLVAPNITPDTDTGVGKLAEDDFQRVMSEGVGKGGYHLYGAMPFTAYTKVTREDNAAIWAYLQTLQPVRNAIEPNQLPFPFSVRYSLIGWNWLNFVEGEFKPNPAKSEEWNRGAYLVEGLGHCGTCHTPKSLLGGDKNDQFLQGGNLDNWFAPNITSDAHKGVGSWSVDDIAQYLKTGSNRFDTASGPMAEEVAHSSQYWADADVKAVAAYLRDVGDSSAAAVPTPIDANDAGMLAGKAIYADRCSACHTPNGDGIQKLFPKLSQAPLINSDDPTSLIRVVLAGSMAGTTKAAPTGAAMPSFAWNLDDHDVANVLTYIRNSWGNAAPAVDPDDVGKLRESLKQ
jgi:mono/diheme cytochrome c family protein